MNREELIRISGIYDNYYPDNKKIVSRIDKNYDDTSNVLLKIDNVNIIDNDGKYLFNKAINKIILKDTILKLDDKLLEVFKALIHPVIKIRGGIYYKGKNIANLKKGKYYNLFINMELPKIIDANTLDRIMEYKNKDIIKYELDDKSKMPLVWPNNDKLLSVVNADVHFKIGNKIIKACNNLSFDIYKGEIFGIVGESGSGKTTITRAIIGLNKLTSGGIYFNGNLISKKCSKEENKKIKKNIQMIFQDPTNSLNERANVEYIVSEGLYSFKLFDSKEDRINKVKNMLKLVGLSEDHLSRYPHEFSGGQRQRIGIARALIVSPELVLADEPISALDVSIRAQILNLLKQLQKDNNLTYLFIAHDLSIIRYICDRIAVMHNGYIVEMGSVEDIYNNPIHPYTKSLLNAILLPDPKNKNIDRIEKYELDEKDYSSWILTEFSNKHYALIKEDKNENK